MFDQLSEWTIVSSQPDNLELSVSSHNIRWGVVMFSVARKQEKTEFFFRGLYLCVQVGRRESQRRYAELMFVRAKLHLGLFSIKTGGRGINSNTINYSLHKRTT